MINVSDSFVRLSNFSAFSQSCTKLLLVFSGSAQPTEADLDAIKALDTEGNVRVNNLISWATGRGDTLLNFNAYGSSLAPRFPNFKFVQWPLSESSELFRQVAEDTPTWFAFLVLDANIGSSEIVEADLATTTTKSNVSYLGTVGDEESEADMKILGGYVDNREYSTTDLEIAFS